MKHSKMMLWRLAWLLFGWHLLLPTTNAMTVRPILISSKPNINSNTQQQPPAATIVFLHGRLEAEPGEPRFDPPEVLYQEFLDLLATTTSARLYLLDYHEALASRAFAKEPKDLRLGPISGALQSCLEEIRTNSNNKILLITFSMGAAMGLKLLHHNPTVLERAIFIEPVWRCWLPFVVSDPKPLSNVPTLALYGTNDSLTRDDSGKSVLGSLRAFLPNLTVTALEGGNHWGILNDGVDIAREGLGEGKTPDEVKKELVEQIAFYCGF